MLPENGGKFEWNRNGTHLKQSNQMLESICQRYSEQINQIQLRSLITTRKKN